ncbi:2-dehydropantoate 2-reductase [Paenibacillus validus]|uniref:ketopantoate reductase family protein n=1 Tax=Paenibacillus validus TaxID=44253 RepID=UPI000FDAD4E1|nr:2-dehydropantoate 2-reductase [Paenibacillus validus]MED4601124.1 2-dehydropantoate 2-reductase [Paenibacillus validus]MED4608200.1 2-dehydropantoate 2-reductase [Paenibacillus validus]
MGRYTIVGAGALGILFAAKLTAGGYRTELVVRREEQRQRLAQEGITLGREGEAPLRVFPDVTRIDEPDAGSRGVAEAPELHYIVLTVKQTDITVQLAENLRSRMGPMSWVVCLQNGIGHAETLATHIPAGRLLLAVTTEAALKRSDTAADHTGQGETWAGPWTPDSSRFQDVSGTERSLREKTQKNLAIELESAGFRTFLSNDITSRIWQKLLINAVVNPLTAILHVRNGELLQTSGLQDYMRDLLAEGEKVAAALGIQLESGLWERLLQVCRLTATNRSSMLQDILAGRRTEIEAINGSLIRKGEDLGLDMTVHKSVYRLVKALEERNSANG